jgi:hypothetical protein
MVEVAEALESSSIDSKSTSKPLGTWQTMMGAGKVFSTSSQQPFEGRKNYLNDSKAIGLGIRINIHPI